MSQQENRKKFALLFGAAFLTYANFYTSFTSFPLYILQLGGTEIQAGLQNTLFFLTAVLLRLYFGPLGDRKGRKILLVIGTFVFATAPLFFILSNSTGVLTLARLYQAIGFATFLSGGRTLVGDLAPAAKIGAYVGVYRLVINLSLLVGPFVALWVIEITDFCHWYIISTVMGVLAFILVVMFKAPVSPRIKSQNKSGSWVHTMTVLKNKDLWPIYSGFILIAVAYGSLLAFASLLIVMVTRTGNPGIYFTCLVLAACFAYPGAGFISDRCGRAAVAWPAIILLGMGAAILFYLAAQPGILIISGLLAGLGYAGSFVTLNVWLIEVAAKQVRSTALALMESTIDLSMAAGSLAFGLAGSRIGLGATFAMTGTVVIIAALFCFLSTKIQRKGSKASQSTAPLAND